jgi:hypothetical protein
MSMQCQIKYFESALLYLAWMNVKSIRKQTLAASVDRWVFNGFQFNELVYWHDSFVIGTTNKYQIKLPKVFGNG